MASFKNGDRGWVYTCGDDLWNTEKDIEFYNDIHGGEEEGEYRHRYMVGQLDANNLDANNADFIQTLDRSIRFLYKRPAPLDEIALELLSVRGKLDFLWQLIMERSNEIPVETRMEYLARFQENMEKCAVAQTMRDKLLVRHLLDPSRVWLRELVDADDAIVAAWYELDESMFCENEGFRGLLQSISG